MMKDWAGPEGWLWKIRFQFRDKDLSGDTLTAGGVVKNTFTQGGIGFVECEIHLDNQRGVRSTTGEAVVALPMRGGAPVPYPFVAPASTT
jgi:hypothetical protein